MIETITDQKVAAGEKADQYVAEFERQKRTDTKSPSWLAPLRRAAFTSFSEFGFPTLQDEDWRFTNVAPILKLPFRPVSTHSRDGLTLETLNQFPFTGLRGSRLIFVNGHFSPELSVIQPQPKGVVIASLAAELMNGHGALEQHLARHARTAGNAFTALNTAFFHDGAFIYVPAGMTVESPVHLLFVSTATETGATAHPRNLIVAERGSALTLLESYVRVTDAATFTNTVTEFVLGENAHVEHCKFQDESTDAYHIAALHMQLGRSANFISHSIATGAKLSRNNITTILDGEGIECVLNGLYLTRGDQLADHHMVVEHVQPRCNSHEYFNGILDGRSKGVFHGRILVRPDAQKTDAKQTNKNLLLSDDATADTKPQLEIYADDVKCTHGATIGQLNEQSIFYLRARGIGLEKARRMLIHAFAGEIIDRIRCEPLREEMDKLVWERLEQSEVVAVGH
ncbi:MAG: Fe-S cluster assembly protein SufD [Verrucomicrobia bacterium]|nr:Fe-S cluster assembly protein SufD [Verrucomicrobiota bacterium]